MNAVPPPVRVEVAGALATIVLDRPEAMNAITVDLGRTLHRAVRELGERADVAVVVIRGAGGNFCAGGDFHEVQRLRQGGADALTPLFVHFGEALRAIERLPQPVVAVVEGVAMAGGFELLQACDLVLVRDDVRLADNHVNFGQVPGGGGSQRLPRLLGRHRALAHLLTGEQWSGPDAVAMGLAHRSFAPADFEDGVRAILDRLATRRPDALAGIKRLVREGLDLDLDAGLDLELATVIEHIGGEAGAAGVRAFAGAPSERTS